MILSRNITTWEPHDPTLRDKHGMTIAMIATICGYIKKLPREFYHNPTIKGNRGWTVAMIAAINMCMEDLPKEFYHDGHIQDNNGCTVVMHIIDSDHI